MSLDCINAKNATQIEFCQIFRLVPNFCNATEWLNVVEQISNSLEELLAFSPEKFWSTIAYTPTALCLLDSLLDFFIRICFFNESSIYLSTDKNISNLFLKTYRQLFFIFLRIFCNLPNENLSNNVFANLIYSHKIVTISTLVKVCSIYGNSNSKLLTKLVEHIFVVQPYFLNDLKNFVASANQFLAKTKFFLSEFAFRTVITVDQIEILVKLADDCTNVLLSIASFAVVHREIDLWLNVFDNIPSFIEQLNKTLSDENLVNFAQKMGVSTFLNSLAYRRSLVMQSAMHCFNTFYTLDTISENEKFSILYENLSFKEFSIRFDDKYCIETEFLKFIQCGICLEEHLKIAINMVEKAYEEKSRAIQTSLLQKQIFNNIGVPNDPDVLITLESLADLLPNYSLEQLHLCLRHFGYDLEKATFALMEKEQLPFELRVLLKKKNTFEEIIKTGTAIHIQSFIDVDQDSNEVNNVLLETSPSLFDLAPPASSASASLWTSNDLKTDSLIINDKKDVQINSNKSLKLANILIKFDGIFDMNDARMVLRSIKPFERLEEKVEFGDKVLIRQDKRQRQQDLIKISAKEKEKIRNTFDRFKYELSDDDDEDGRYDLDARFAAIVGQTGRFNKESIDIAKPSTTTKQQLSRPINEDMFDKDNNRSVKKEEKKAISRLENSFESDESESKPASNNHNAPFRSFKNHQENVKNNNQNSKANQHQEFKKSSHKANTRTAQPTASSDAPPGFSKREENSDKNKASSGGYTGGKARLNKERNKGKLKQRGADRKQRGGMF